MFRDNEPQLRERLLERSSSKEKCVERIKGLAGPEGSLRIDHHLLHSAGRSIYPY